MLEHDFTWSDSTIGTSSGGLTAIEIPFSPQQSVLYLQHSTLATTNSVSFQTAQQSSGPWFIEASTALSTAVSTQHALRVTGPFALMRPYLHTVSTGAYRLRLLAVAG